MACSAQDIPNLSFPRDEIIEIIPASYNNESRRIHIPGLPQKLIPASPEDIRIPVPPSVVPSGAVSPMSGLGTPAHGEGSGNNYAYIVTDDKTKDAVVIDPANPSDHHDHAGGNAEM
ncbi:hypothetical protein KC343_g19344, partial [Hortaea werneckii]